ncbi:MAG TPA: GIY-YIG nuclease family protein [Chromatiales bacterium]|nr:GIY-YIG nuclease family protein [Chromatiales bacterium]
MQGLQPAAGTYVLILHCRQEQEIQVGRLGALQLREGTYLYVGSAFGPGGVAARCGHHMRVSQRPRWHIDYLRAVCELEQIWFACDPVRREHEWARILSGMPGSHAPCPGFGASDCGCLTHLFFRRRRPRLATFLRYLRQAQTGADVHLKPSKIMLIKVTSSSRIQGISHDL